MDEFEFEFRISISRKFANTYRQIALQKIRIPPFLAMATETVMNKYIHMYTFTNFVKKIKNISQTLLRNIY